MQKHIPIFAHRGASGYCLENTFSAFEKARKLGADGIELDVQQTKDGVLVVYHDMNLFRLTGQKKNSIDCTYEQLSLMPIGKRVTRRLSKHRIPTLQEVVDWANNHNMPLNIELKESLLIDSTNLVNMLQQLTLPTGSMLSSFHDELIKIVKMQRPEFETGFIVTKKFNWNDLSKLTHIDAVHAHKKYYKEQYLQACTDARKDVRFYSIVGNESYLKNPHPSVIGWITDYPDKVAKAQKNKRRSM